MVQELKSYILEQVACIPHDVYVALFQILCIVSVFLVIWKGWKVGTWCVLWLLLCEYLLLILCSTIIYREVSNVHPVHFQLFWSYYENSTGQFEIEPEHIMNVLMFVPVGVLNGVLAKKYALLITFFFGLSFSCSIEGTQFLMYRGTCEIDDVMNNTAGCVIGCFLFLSARKVYQLCGL